MKDDIIQEAREKRLQAIGLLGVLRHQILKLGERLDLLDRPDLLGLLGRVLALEAGFRLFKLGALGFHRLHPLAHGGQGILATLGQDIDQPGQFRANDGQLSPYPLEVRHDLGQGLGGKLIRLLCDGTDVLGLEVEEFHELQDPPVQGLGRDVDPGTGTPHGLLGLAAEVVGVVLPALAPAGPGGHLVAAESAAEEPLEEVDVLPRLPLGAPVAPVVLVHQLPDSLVGLPGADGLPLGVVELPLVVLLAGVDLIPEHPAEDLLRVERPPGGPVAPLPELDHELVHALALEIERLRRPDVGGVGLVETEDLALHLESHGRGTDRKAPFCAPEDLVLDPHRRQLALLLGERDHEDRLEAARRGREIDILPDRDDLDANPVQLLDQLEEVDDASRDAVDLRDDDHVDQLRSGEFEELLEGGARGVLGALPVPLPVLLALDQLLGHVPLMARRPLVLDESGEAIQLGVE